MNMGGIGTDDCPWDPANDEGYWQALLVQGEVPPSPRPSWETENHAEGTPGTDRYTSSESAQEREQDWQASLKAFQEGEVLDLIVIGYNRGGLLVQFGSLKAFVPASHLVGLPRLPSPEDRERAFAAKIGESLALKIIEIDRVRGRLILSERAARQESLEDTLSQIRSGDALKGCVTNIRPFGAFVDLGGIEGLVHVSELAWTRVEHPADMLKLGQEVEVYVINVDKSQRKVALSLKRLQPDPWSLVAARYEVGQIISSTITNVVSFGAFARLNEGIEGLIHISELAEGNFLHPRNVVQEGDEVQARILSMDPTNHRLALSLRQVQSSRCQEADSLPAPLGQADEHPERQSV